MLEKLLESPSVFDLLSALLNMEKTALFQQKIYRYGFKWEQEPYLSILIEIL